MNRLKGRMLAGVLAAVTLFSSVTPGTVRAAEPSEADTSVEAFSVAEESEPESTEGLEESDTTSDESSGEAAAERTAAEEDEELVLKALTEATKEAAANLDAMRIVEGAKLMEDILQRGQLIEQTVCGIEVYAPEVAKNYAAKMKERIQELLGDEATIPEDRIVLEAAVFADKSNITEEMVRLKSHCSQLKSIAADTSGPIGKKLDFLVQEMNRESNTIGSKANDIRITNDVLLLKAEIEKIREQVQNIE